MLEVKDLKKYYKTKGGVVVHALDGVSIKFPETGMVFLLGKSGSGKSTLLNVSGGLDKPDSGEIIVKGKSSKDFSRSDFDAYRNTFIGFIFQEYNILNEYNIESNISLALELQGKKSDKKAVEALLKQVDLAGMGKRKPNTLSGGQKQRIAIARALIKEPEIIMADEPTGALDSTTGRQVFDTLKKLSENKLIIIVSHDRDFAEEYADRIIELKDGKILSDVSRATIDGDEISKNVRKIGNDTIQIKEASKLSDEEIAEIIKSIRGKGEVIISKGEENNTKFKKVAKISDNGGSECFKDTDLKNVKINEYDGTKTEFIKSSLPMKHGFKLGASNLKIKPGRLFLTMLLSIIAFSISGVLSTLMLYNPAYSYSKAIQGEAYKALKLKKQYTVVTDQYQIDSNGVEEFYNSYETDKDSKISKTDITNLNNNSYGLDYAGYYEAKMDYSSHLRMVPTLPYYKQNEFSAICDCGESYLTRQGFSKLAGKYPTTPTEIAISEYTYETFKECGYKNKEGESKTITKEEDLIGLPLNLALISSSGMVKNIDFTISGVYQLDNAYENEKYNILKEEDISSISTKDYEELINSFDDVYYSSFYGMAFVSSDFYETYKKYLVSNEYDNVYVPADYMYGLKYIDSDGYYTFKNDPEYAEEMYPTYSNDCCYALSMKGMNSYKDYFVFMDTEGNIVSAPTSLKMNEIYLDGTEAIYYKAQWDLIDRASSFRCGGFNRNGELVYYDTYNYGEAGLIYLNKTTFDYKPFAAEGYEPVIEVIVDDDGKVMLYEDIYYTDYSRSGYKKEAEGSFDEQVCVWINKEGNVVADEGNYEYSGFDQFFLDPRTNNVYLDKDIDVDGDKFLLKSDHSVELTLIHGVYEIDSSGNVSTPEYSENPRRGLFVDPVTGDLSLTKKAGYKFTDEYFVDGDGKVYIGKSFSQIYYQKLENGEYIYAFSYNGIPLGIVDMSFYYTKEYRIISEYPDALKAISKYLYLRGDSYLLSTIQRNFPEFDLDSALNEEFNFSEMKNVIEAYNAFLDRYGEFDDIKLDEDCAILTTNREKYEMEVKGFYFRKTNGNAPTILLADGWNDRIIYPSDYTPYEYTWKEIERTNYVVQPNAQYNGAISLSNLTTEELTLMMKKYDDDSFYKIDNSISWIFYINEK